jgi:hypothetical protein
MPISRKENVKAAAAVSLLLQLLCVLVLAFAVCVALGRYELPGCFEVQP